jgi:hypothetical protein
VEKLTTLAEAAAFIPRSEKTPRPQGGVKGHAPVIDPQEMYMG